MASQVKNGKAFEYSVAVAVSETLNVPILHSAEFDYSRECFLDVDTALQTRFTEAAELASHHIVMKENQNLKNLEPKDIWVAGDSAGQRGDVRDVVIGGSYGELGISCKTNHDAFKHSRLSGKNDFVRSWYLDPAGCSDEYWSTVKPIFAELASIRETSGRTKLWRELRDVPERFYWPILDAFEKELLRLMAKDQEAPGEVSRNLISYIIGNEDFYKVIVRPDQVEIQGFNLGGSLAVPKTKSPEHILGIDKLDGGQFSKTVRFNRGYTFNFRIHSASSRVEPSLKFDIKAVALPPSEIYTHHISLAPEPLIPTEIVIADS